jgi:CBS domain-containing protein
MQVRELMSRDVATIDPGTTLRDAARRMAALDVGALPVSEEDRLVGMITDRDIAVRGIAKGYGPDTPVRDLMTNDVICARVDQDIEEVATKMSEAQVRRLPVIDDQQRLCGIVSLGDLARETNDDSAQQALEGVVQPGGAHRQ